MLKALFLLVVFLYTPEAAAQTFHISSDEALRVIFPQSSWTTEEKTLNAKDLKKIAKASGTKFTQSTWRFYVVRSQQNLVGYALIDQEIGKHEPITFLVAFNAQGQVQAVEILAYRENYGGEVREKPFLKQFAGKTHLDPLQLGNSVQNITGATFSARAITRGVKRALILWNHFYGQSAA